MTQDLLDLLQEGAELVRHSQFSLAVEKAQEKLKKFQLPDPRYYIAQILQALLASGAQRINVFIQGDSVRVAFDGLGYSQNELKNLTDAVFESGKNRDRDRIREMALGLLSVQGLKPKEVTLSSGGFRWNKNLKVLETCAADLQEFCVVHRRGNADEEKILRQVTQSCRAEIRINGHIVCSLEGSLVTSCPWPNFNFQGNGFSGAFGISYGNIECSTLALTRYGVVFSRRQENRIQPPLVVEMEHSALRKNASQSDVVEDEHYTQMLADLQKIQLEFALKLSSQRLPPYQAANVFDYLREIVLQNITPEMLELPEDALDALETRLLKAPLLAGANGRRYSLRDLQLSQPIFYLSQMVRSNSNLPEITLLLADKDVPRMSKLFQVYPLNAGDHQRQRNLLEKQSSQAKPAVLVMSRLGSGEKSFELALLKVPPPGAEILHYRCQGNIVQATHSLGRGKLHWAIFSPSNLDEKKLGTLQPAIEALYEQIPSRLQTEGRRGFKIPMQQRLAEYLTFKHGSVALALSEPKWRELRLFSTCSGANVSILDLQAWLEVYPQVIVSHSPLATCQDDHALLLSPEWLKPLQQVFTQEKIKLASLSQPYILERTQQGGLSEAALKGVERVQQEDEDEELAAIRREIQGAQQGLLKVEEEQPLDAEAVLNYLQIQKPGESAQEVPEFARQCLDATASLKTRWISRFQLPGLQGQVLMHTGTLPSPLQAEHLLVKVADNDPVAYPLDFLGMSGWLQIPPNWTVPQSLDEIERVTPDSRSTLGELTPESIEWPFDLGQPTLHLDLLWATRRLFKFAAQHVGMAAPMDPQVALWKRPLSLYLLWDDAWALSAPESWFSRLSLWSNWRGHWRSLNQWRQQPGDLFCAPLGGGSVVSPEQTIRLLPPFTRQKLEAWLSRPLPAPEIRTGQQEQDQLLSQLKEHLVQSCQLAGCPLEASWLDGLQFGEPSRWILGPRKYFIAHQPAQGSTRLNPASATLKQLVGEPQNWPTQTPVLASAIYTAINRALDEVDDQHELAYLEAMLSQLG